MEKVTFEIVDAPVREHRRGCYVGGFSVLFSEAITSIPPGKAIAIPVGSRAEMTAKRMRVYGIVRSVTLYPDPATRPLISTSYDAESGTLLVWRRDTQSPQVFVV